MRTEKMRQKNIQKVFAAAPILFAKYGVFETTLQMIAEEAKLSTRSVVNYFTTRENLLLQVYIRNYKHRAEIVKEFCEDKKYLKKTGKEQILACMKAYLDDVKANYADLCYLIEIEAVLASKEKLGKKDIHKEFVAAITEAVTVAYRKGVEDGSIQNKRLSADKDIPFFIYSMKGLFRLYATALKVGERKEIKSHATAIESLFKYVGDVLDLA